MTVKSFKTISLALASVCGLMSQDGNNMFASALQPAARIVPVSDGISTSLSGNDATPAAEDYGSKYLWNLRHLISKEDFQQLKTYVLGHARTRFGFLRREWHWAVSWRFWTLNGIKGIARDNGTIVNLIEQIKSYVPDVALVRDVRAHINTIKTSFDRKEEGTDAETEFFTMTRMRVVLRKSDLPERVKLVINQYRWELFDKTFNLKHRVTSDDITKSKRLADLEGWIIESAYCYLPDDPWTLILRNDPRGKSKTNAALVLDALSTAETIFQESGKRTGDASSTTETIFRENGKRAKELDAWQSKVLEATALVDSIPEDFKNESVKQLVGALQNIPCAAPPPDVYSGIPPQLLTATEPRASRAAPPSPLPSRTSLVTPLPSSVSSSGLPLTHL